MIFQIFITDLCYCCKSSTKNYFDTQAILAEDEGREDNKNIVLQSRGSRSSPSSHICIFHDLKRTTKVAVMWFCGERECLDIKVKISKRQIYYTVSAQWSISNISKGPFWPFPLHAVRCCCHEWKGRQQHSIAECRIVNETDILPPLHMSTLKFETSREVPTMWFFVQGVCLDNEVYPRF